MFPGPQQMPSMPPLPKGGSPPRAYYGQVMAQTPSPGQPLAVKMEPVQRKIIPSYTFQTKQIQQGNAVGGYYEKPDVTSKSDYFNYKSGNLVGYEKAKDLNATFNPNQLQNNYVSKGYDMTSSLTRKSSYEGSKGFSTPQTESYFSKYAKNDKIQQTPTFYEPWKKEAVMVPTSNENNVLYMKSYYERMEESSKFAESMALASSPYSSPSTSELKESKIKLAEATQQLTKSSLQKSQLIKQIAELKKQSKQLINAEQKWMGQKEELFSKLASLSDQNEQLKKRSKQLQQQNEDLKKKVSALEEQPKGMIIDEEMLIQLEGIKQRQGQLNKMKEQFMQILETKYQEEIKRIIDLNSTMKVELQNAKFDLNLAKEAAKEKQLKFQYVQKEVEALESKVRAQSRSMKEQVDGQIQEKSNQIVALKHALNSLQVKYKAQRKQLADKDDFIAKYLAGRGGEDAQAIQMLINKYNFYSRQKFQEISQNSPSK